MTYLILVFEIHKDSSLFFEKWLKPTWEGDVRVADSLIINMCKIEGVSSRLIIHLKSTKLGYMYKPELNNVKERWPKHPKIGAFKFQWSDVAKIEILPHKLVSTPVNFAIVAFQARVQKLHLIDLRRFITKMVNAQPITSYLNIKPVNTPFYVWFYSLQKLQLSIVDCHHSIHYYDGSTHTTSCCYQESNNSLAHSCDPNLCPFTISITFHHPRRLWLLSHVVTKLFACDRSLRRRWLVAGVLILML